MVNHLIKNDKTQAYHEHWCDIESVLKSIDPPATAEKTDHDESTPYERPPDLARLNVDCNREAKDWMQAAGVSKEKPSPPKGTKVDSCFDTRLIPLTTKT